MPGSRTPGSVAAPTAPHLRRRCPVEGVYFAPTLCWRGKHGWAVRRHLSTGAAVAKRGRKRGRQRGRHPDCMKQLAAERNCSLIVSCFEPLPPNFRRCPGRPANNCCAVLTQTLNFRLDRRMKSRGNRLDLGISQHWHGFQKRIDFLVGDFKSFRPPWFVGWTRPTSRMCGKH